MNPSTERRAEIATALHQLADMIATTELPVPYSLDCMVFSGIMKGVNGTDHSIDTPVGLALAAAQMGKAEKLADENHFQLKRDFGGSVTYTIYATRKGVCEQVKVGTKVIPAKEARVIPEQVIPATEARIEDVFEWKCPSLLKAGASVVLDATAEIPAPEPALALASGDDEDDMPF